MSSCISYDSRYVQCFPEEKAFVIQISDVVFEVETELYTCYMNSMIQSQSCVPYERTVSGYWENIHGFREIIWKYFAVTFVCFQLKGSTVILINSWKHRTLTVVYLQFQKLFVSNWRVCLLPVIGNIVKQNIIY